MQTSTARALGWSALLAAVATTLTLRLVGDADVVPASFRPPGAAQEVLGSTSIGASIGAGLDSAPRRLASRAVAVVLLDAAGLATTPGAGTVFVRPSGATESDPARELPIRAGQVDLGDLPDVAFLGARVDGRPFVPDASRSDRERVVLTPFAGTWIEVRDRAGRPARDLEVRRGELASGREGALHPGTFVGARVLRSTAASPVLIGAEEWSRPDGALFVGSPGMRWVHVTARPHTPRCLDVALEPGGALVVEFGAGADLEGLALRVEGEYGCSQTWHGLRGAPLRIDGLPPGSAELVLGAPRGARRDALEVLAADVSAGGSATVLLRAGGAPDPSRGLLHGTLALPGLAPADRALLADLLRLRVIHQETSEGARGLGRVRELLVARMDRDADGQGWTWHVPELPPGGYRLAVQPLGLLVEAWIEPGGATVVPLVVDEIADARVRFRDEVSGEFVSVEVGSAYGMAATFGELSMTRLRPENVRGAGTRLLAVPGTVALDVRDPVYGQFTVELELPAGSSEPVVEVGEARWLELELVAPAGPLAPPTEWWEAVELVRGGQTVEVLTRAYPLGPERPTAAGRHAELHVCFRGSEAVTLILPALAGYDASAPISIPARGPGEGPRRRAVLRATPEE